MKTPAYLDPIAARAYFNYIKGGDALVEVRIPKAYGLRSGDRSFPCGGWFDSFDALEEQLSSQVGDYEGGIYVTLNTVHDGLLARKNGHNRLTKRDDTTKDAEITRRKFLVVDLDPKRPSNISSTDAEHEAACSRAKEIGKFLTSAGWPDPMFCDSGNGFHLIYAIDLPAADGDLVKNALHALAHLFPSGPALPGGSGLAGACPVEVDTGMWNPSRICKLVGTAAKKGGSTPERPWRMSKIIFEPMSFSPTVTKEQVETLAKQAPAGGASNRAAGGAAVFSAVGAIGAPIPARAPSTGLVGVPFIEDFITRHSLKVKGPKPWQGAGSIWTLQTDPVTQFNDGSCFLGVQPDGAYFAGCHHNSAPWGWKELCAALGEERGNPELKALDAQYAPHDGHVDLGGFMTGAAAPGAPPAERPKKAGAPAKDAAPFPKEGKVSPAPAAQPPAIPSDPPRGAPAAHAPTQPGGAPPVSTVKKFSTTQGMAQELLSSTEMVCPITGEAGVQAMRVWRGNIYTLSGSSGNYEPVGETEFASRIREAAHSWRKLKQKGHDPLDLTRRVIGDIKAAVVESGAVAAPAGQEAPIWLGTQSSCPWPDLRETAVFTDGVLDLSSGELSPHTPNFFQTYSFTCAAPKCPPNQLCAEPVQFTRWVREFLFPGDEDALRLLQEWCGYCLTGRADLQKGMMIIGPPASGKSALLDLMGRIFGDAAVGLDLNSIVDPHTLCGCVGKRLLTIADARIDPVSRNSSILVEKLLQMIGQDQMSLARKYLSAYVGKFPCRIMIASNEVPQIRETSSAIGRRFLILTTSRAVAPHLQDPEFISKIMREKEQILAWMVDGWRRLKKNGYNWTTVAASAEAHADLRRAGGSVAAFIEDCMIISRSDDSSPSSHSSLFEDHSPDEYFIHSDDIFSEYSAFCLGQGMIHMVSAAKFPRAFETAAGIPRVFKKKTRGISSETVFFGCRWNNEGLEAAADVRKLTNRVKEQEAVERAKERTEAFGGWWTKDKEEK